MKIIFGAFIILIFGWSPVFASTSSGDIDLFFNELAVALNSKRGDLVANSFSDSGELISLAGGIFKGRQEIQTFFDEGFAGPYKKAKFENFIQYVRMIGPDYAVVDGVWKVTGSNIANYPSCGIFLFNLKKQSGLWKAEMFYSSVPGKGHTSEHGRTVSWTEICTEKSP